MFSTVLICFELMSLNREKDLLGSNYFSITTDHWTSMCNDNYGAITAHFIDSNFKLRSLLYHLRTCQWLFRGGVTRAIVRCPQS